MAHRGKGGRKPKPQKKAKHAQHFARCEAHKRKRKQKWEKDRAYWKSNREYQKRQEKRAEKIKNYKPGTKFHNKAINEARDQAKKTRNKKK